MRVYPKGDSALIIYSDRKPSRELTHKIKLYRNEILKKNFPYIEEIVPSENSIMIIYHPYSMMMNYKINAPYTFMKEQIESVIQEISSKTTEKIVNKKTITLDVEVGGESGPDFDNLIGETKETKINMLESCVYFVSMIGRTPGCPYLAGLSEYYIPKEKSYKTLIPKGSLCIEKDKLFIAPKNIKGYWPVIGKVNEEIFELETATSKFDIGDEIILNVINKDEMKDNGGL